KEVILFNSLVNFKILDDKKKKCRITTVVHSGMSRKFHSMFMLYRTYLTKTLFSGWLLSILGDCSSLALAKFRFSISFCIEIVHKNFRLVHLTLSFEQPIAASRNQSSLYYPLLGCFPARWAAAHRLGTASLCNYHKAKQSSEYSRYAPCRVPCVWMVITYRQTQTSVCFEPAIRSDHVNAGWLKWKISWEN
ncbi:hypothetical protein AGLY_002901, partial [Aphis glycines]